METAHTKVIPFPLLEAGELIDEYRKDRLANRDQDTVEVYLRSLRKFATWMSVLPGHDEQFHPESITHHLVGIFLGMLRSSSYKNQAKSAISGFCTWLVEEKQVLARNPTRGIVVPAQALLAPHVLSEEQRVVVRDLVDCENDLRGKAAFALVFWAGCRVSDISHLLFEHTHLTTKAGWLVVGHKDKKVREIDLINEGCKPLYGLPTKQARR